MRLFVETAKNHIADYNNVNLTKKIENVQVKIIDNRNEINGYSFYYNGHNIICINSGALIKLMEVMLAFVENSNFMPSIGTVSKNHLEEKPKSKVINNRIEWSTYIQDSTRQDLAFALYYFACLTLIYHEIGHLIHGHTQISKNHIFNYLSICEMACRIRHGVTGKIK
jgi:hypothetical protein